MKLEKRYRSYIILSVLLFIVIFTVFIILPLLQSEEIPEREKTYALLKKMENQDISEVNKEIKEAQKAVSLNNAKTPFETLNIQFQNSVIIGDSIGEGLAGYQILNANIILAARGLRIDNCGNQIQAAIARRPEAIFLEFGMNDITYWRGNATSFINAYREQIETLKKALPDTKIYVNGILPITSTAVAKSTYYASYPTFNQELEKLCKEKKVNYIDNAFIIKSMIVPYEFDGIHPKYEYYQQWAMNMAAEAGL